MEKKNMMSEEDEFYKKLEELMENTDQNYDDTYFDSNEKLFGKPPVTGARKDITKISLTLSANTLPIYTDGPVTVTLQTGRGVSLREDSVTCFVYSDDLFPMCNSEEAGEFRRAGANRVEIEIPCQHIWLPGDYILYVREQRDNTLTRIPFRLSAALEATLDASEDCLPCSIDDILTSCVENNEECWELLAHTPGTAQLRRYALDNRRLKVYNEFRKAMSGKELLAERNLLVYTLNKDWTDEMLHTFQKLTVWSSYFTFIDSATLYNAALTNPFEVLNEKLSITTNQVYCLTNIGSLLNTGGKLIVKRIIEKINDHSAVFNLWLCGIRHEVESVLEMHPSLRSLFHRDAHVSQLPYTGFEFVQTFFMALRDEHLDPSDEVKDSLSRTILRLHQQGCFATWTLDDTRRFVAENVRPRYMCRALDDILNQDEFLPRLEMDDIDLSQLPSSVSAFEDSIADLNRMVGLDDIKCRIVTMANQTRFFVERRRAGLPTTCNSVHHAIFTGNPGTGKTTVAKMLGRIYHSIGLLSHGDVICADRTRLVGRYIGETEENMKVVLEEARGNVLFIDEAYTLYDGANDQKDYGRKVIDSLLPVLSQSDSDMVIIFAGYEKEMDAMLTSNPGLTGRFPYKFRFPDYTADQLMEIACHLLSVDEYILDTAAEKLLRQYIHETLAQRTKNFGNARWVEQLVRNGIIPAMATRVTRAAQKDYRLVMASDVEEGYLHFNPRVIELKPRQKVGFSA